MRNNLELERRVPLLLYLLAISAVLLPISKIYPHLYDRAADVFHRNPPTHAPNGELLLPPLAAACTLLFLSAYGLRNLHRVYEPLSELFRSGGRHLLQILSGERDDFLAPMPENR